MIVPRLRGGARRSGRFELLLHLLLILKVGSDKLALDHLLEPVLLDEGLEVDHLERHLALPCVVLLLLLRKLFAPPGGVPLVLALLIALARGVAEHDQVGLAGDGVRADATEPRHHALEILVLEVEGEFLRLLIDEGGGGGNR
jgi:hypothetical protein